MRSFFKHFSTLALLSFISTTSFADDNKPVVVMETTAGTMTIELFDKKAPITVKNFLEYVDSGFYNGTIFHRVIPNFVLQGGGFTKEMDKKPVNAPIKNESDNGLRNEKGTLSMARMPDPDSASSQFFVNLRMNNNLDYRSGQHGYAVFGKVIEGLDVMEKIARTQTGQVGPYSDVPVEPIIMTSVHRKVKKAEAVAPAAPAAPAALSVQ